VAGGPPGDPELEKLKDSSSKVSPARARSDVDQGVSVDRFITIAGLALSGVWLTVLAIIAVLQRF